MSLGIPGDAVMALLLGALIIHGITPGPRLIVEHPDIFWGLIASFWIGNIILDLPQRADDRPVGEDADGALQVSVPERAVLHLHRRLRRQEHAVRRGRDAVLRRVRLPADAAEVRAGADPARLRAGAAARGEFPPRRCHLARRHGDLRRAADQRVLRRRSARCCCWGRFTCGCGRRKSRTCCVRAAGETVSNRPPSEEIPAARFRPLRFAGAGFFVARSPSREKTHEIVHHAFESLLAAICARRPRSAQDAVADFYRGKQVQVRIGRRPAPATTSRRGSSRAISANTFPAIPTSSCRTFPARAASR